MKQTINVMKRFEMKYILTPSQVEYVKRELQSYMKVDSYGLTSIASLYYDTPDHRLIRASLEKPSFKEKIRLRSYGLAKEDSKIFLELKRKADGIVYKRRATTTLPQAALFFQGKEDVVQEDQIGKEITYFRDYYQNLIPSCLIIYDRVAYFQEEGDLRLTLDANPRYRVKDLNLTTSLEGIPLLPDGYVIMEIKVQESMPLWLTKILDDGKIYKNSFSKYGEAYKREFSFLPLERRIQAYV